MEESKLGTATLLALAAAIVGGVVWALIAIFANFEFGVIAWGIGLVAGYAVTFPSKESLTRNHQFVAVLASLIGIIFGKYLIFAYFIELSFFSPTTISFFFNYFFDMFGLMDILFIVLAVVTAWQVPVRVAYQAEVAQAEEEAHAEALAQAQEERITQGEKAVQAQENKDDVLK